MKFGLYFDDNEELERIITWNPKVQAKHCLRPLMMFLETLLALLGHTMIHTKHMRY